jgi:hypothetical protein
VFSTWPIEIWILFKAFEWGMGHRGITVLSGMKEMPSQSNPTTGLTLLWARNPFRGHFNRWQLSQEYVRFQVLTAASMMFRVQNKYIIRAG